MNPQNTFQRYEKKYLLTDQQYQRIRLKLSGRMEPDHYGTHQICNLYYDTKQFSLIRKSIQKPVYKEKLRLRSYGVPGENDTVFLELKKKYRGVVYKRRIPAKQAEAREYLAGIHAMPECQVANEIDWFLEFYHPVPKVFVGYKRIALYGTETPDLRVTFDFDIRCRDHCLDLSYGPGGDCILDKGLRLMEVKIPGSMPIWMSRLFSELEIYPTSFSKYGEYYRQYLQNTQKGVVSHVG